MADVSLFYADTGTGDPLLFLNGLAGDHLYWTAQIRAFSNRFRCIAPDCRDAGESPYSVEPYTVGDLAEDIARLIQSIHLKPVHVVGISLGGMVGQELALRYPHLVRSLVLSNTLARADAWFMATLDAFCLIRKQVAGTPEFFQALMPWLVSHQYFESSTRIEWLKAILGQNPHPQRIDGFFRQLEAIRGMDTLDRLPAIRCPVLVAAGEHDMICPPRYAQQMVAQLPHARLEILPGVGHAPPIEENRRFNRLLGEFLEKQ